MGIPIPMVWIGGKEAEENCAESGALSMTHLP